jgi:hypothetical protein
MYLPPPLKEKVDTILKAVVENSPYTKQLYEQYAGHQYDLLDTYADSNKTKGRKMSEWSYKFYHPGKGDDTSRHNAIVRAALGLDNTGIESQAYRAKSGDEAAKLLLHSVASNLRQTLTQEENRQQRDARKPKKERERSKRSNISHDDYLER